MKKTATILLSVVLSGATFAQIPTDNLLCHMKFDNNYSEEVSASSATLAGAMNSGFADDRFGNPSSAISLSNNPHGYLTLGDLNLVDPDYSISFWMNYTSISTGQRKILSKREACAGGSFFDISLDPTWGNFVFESGANGDYSANLNNTFTAALSWDHITVVVDQTAQATYYYVNGNLVNTVNWGQALIDGTMDNTASLLIGSSPCVNGTTIKGYDGLLDDLRIYTRALTSTEVTALYNEPNPTASISTLNKQDGMEVYPNPTGSNLTISVSEPTSIRIVNANGVELLSKDMMDNTTIDVSTFASGIYFVKTSEGQVTKFIKQ